MIVNKYQGQGGGSGSGYTLPTATETRLGGVKIGSGVSVAADGTISVSGGTGGEVSFNLDAMTQQERADFVAYMTGLTEDERVKTVIYKGNARCVYGYMDSGKVGLRVSKEDGWSVPVMQYQFFFVKADGDFEYQGDGKFANVISFYTDIADTAHTLTQPDNISPLNIVGGLDGGDARLALNVKLITSDNPYLAVLSTTCSAERDDTYGGYLRATFDYSGQTISAEWRIWENSATNTKWEVSQGGGGGITAYYFNEMTQAELAALYTLLETEAGRPDSEGVLSANTINEKYAFFNDFANPATVPPDMEYIRLQFYGFYYGRAVFVQTLTKADGADGVNNYLVWLQSNGTFERMERSQRDFPTKGTQTVGYFDDSSNYIVYNKGNNTFTDKDGNALANGGGFGGSLYWFVMHPIQGDWGNGIATVPFKVIDANSAETMHYYASVEMETLAAPITIDGVEYTEKFAFKYSDFTFGGYVNGTPQYASLTFKEESEIAIIDFINDLSSNINKVGKKIEEAYNDNKQIFLRGKDTYNSGYTLLPFYQYTTYAGNPRYIFKGSSISNNNSGECIYNVYAQKSAATGNWSLSGVSGSHFNAVHTTTPIWTGTQAQYNALGSYDPNTLYIIKNS